MQHLGIRNYTCIPLILRLSVARFLLSDLFDDLTFYDSWYFKSQCFIYYHMECFKAQSLYNRWLRCCKSSLQCKTQWAWCKAKFSSKETVENYFFFRYSQGETVDLRMSRAGSTSRILIYDAALMLNFKSQNVNFTLYHCELFTVFRWIHVCCVQSWMMRTA